MNSPERALSGVRVLDFSRVLAGPFCTMMLGDMGAEVIKVEAPETGDECRQWGPPWVDEDRAISAYFACVNRNKKSVTLNLAQPQGRELAAELASRSQIVVENFRPGVADKLGLRFDGLARRNPSLIYCRITGFGSSGSYSRRPGYDYVVQAMSGLMSITGPKEGEPAKVGVAISDVIAGLYATQTILAALRLSERTGRGQFLDVSLLDCQLAALVNVAGNYLASGKSPQRYGNQHPNVSPYQTFQASDGRFVVAVGNDRQFEKLCRLLGSAELSRDARFGTNPARVVNRDALAEELGRRFATRTAQDRVQLLVENSIPAGPINDVAAILESDHIRERGLVGESKLDSGRPFRYIGFPVGMSEAVRVPTEVTEFAQRAQRLAPPELGRHTDSVLSDLLGLSARQLQVYREQGIV